MYSIAFLAVYFPSTSSKHPTFPQTGQTTKLIESPPQRLSGFTKPPHWSWRLFVAEQEQQEKRKQSENKEKKKIQ
jgi:hypothetical protein